ncbi:hypothetical protein L0F63_003235 [Massospora cicadina]|nr:hypothetical protein L0F63_003235 [Massospora cicadina]
MRSTHYIPIPVCNLIKPREFGSELVEAILSEDSVALVRTLVERDVKLAFNCLRTFRYPNLDVRFHHPHEYQRDAHSLLGNEVRNLNCLHMALMNGDGELAEWLLNFLLDASLDQGDPRVLVTFLAATCGGGNTPLHLAAFFGMAEVVHRLLELGANPNTRNALKFRPVDCADSAETRSQFQDLAQFDHHPSLRSMGQIMLRQTLAREPIGLSLDSAPTPLSTPELITRSCSSSTSSSGSEGGTPLVSCFGSDKAARRRWLAGRRVKFDPCTLLVHATVTGDENLANDAIAPYLALPSNQPSLRDFRSPRRRATFLHLAAGHRYPHMVLFWLQHGIDVNAQDKDGFTPLHLACAEGDLASVSLLIEYGGSFDTRSNDYRTPWDMTKCPIVLNLLRKAHLPAKLQCLQPLPSTAPTPAASPRVSKMGSQYSSATIRHIRPRQLNQSQVSILSMP